MKKESLIKYIAGYIEGDGCFRCNITTKKSGIIVYERSISITSVKKEVIYIFKRFFGGNVSKKEAYQNKRKAYTWTIKGINAENLAKEIEKFLYSKHIQCRIFILFCESIRPNFWKKPSKQIINKRNFYLEEIRKEIHQQDLVTKEKIMNLKKLKKSVEPTISDFIYLSGLIDAEGCLRISSRFRTRNCKKEKVYNTVLEIGNSKFKIIEWLAKRFGGSLCFLEKKQSNRLAIGYWAIHAKKLFPILTTIKSFLINKKSVCNELIKFQKTILPNGGDRHSKIFAKDFKRRILQREKIIKKVHKLNHKGNF